MFPAFLFTLAQSMAAATVWHTSDTIVELASNVENDSAELGAIDNDHNDSRSYTFP